MKAGLSIACALVLLSGCGRFAPTPSDTFYRFAPLSNSSAYGGANRWVDSTLSVERFRARGVYKDRALAVAGSDAVSVKQQRYHYWHESPELMLQQRFAEHARAAGLAKDVVIHSNHSASFTVSGKLHRLERTRLASGTGIAIDMELTVSKLEPTPEILYRERLTLDQAVGGGDESDSVQAISQAVDKLFAQFITNASQVIEH